jgi:hypothetical protein
MTDNRFAVLVPLPRDAGRRARARSKTLTTSTPLGGNDDMTEWEGNASDLLAIDQSGVMSTSGHAHLLSGVTVPEFTAKTPSSF